MEQVLVCLKSNGVIKIDAVDTWRKELVALGKAIISGNKQSIEKHVSAALDAGTSREDIMEVVAFIMSDNRLLRSIIELMRVLNYEENRRVPCISILDDVREW